MNQDDNQDNTSHKSMNRCQKQEGDKVPLIPIAYAGTHPWAVVVVHLNADVASAAVK